MKKKKIHEILPEKEDINTLPDDSMYPETTEINLDEDNDNESEETEIETDSSDSTLSVSMIDTSEDEPEELIESKNTQEGGTPSPLCI